MNFKKICDKKSSKIAFNSNSFVSTEEVVKSLIAFVEEAGLNDAYFNEEICISPTETDKEKIDEFIELTVDHVNSFAPEEFEFDIIRDSSRENGYWGFSPIYEWWKTSSIDDFDTNLEKYEFIEQVKLLGFDYDDVDEVETAVTSYSDVIIQILIEMNNYGVESGYVAGSIVSSETNVVTMEKFQRDVAMQVAEESIVLSDLQWPLNCIDWDEAYKNLENGDYHTFSVVHDGERFIRFFVCINIIN